jgi:hypothetical protein
VLGAFHRIAADAVRRSARRVAPFLCFLFEKAAYQGFDLVLRPWPQILKATASVLSGG